VMFVGCSKCGTSSIASYMLSHPEVIMQARPPSAGWDVPKADEASGTKLVALETHIFDYHKRSNETMASLHWDWSPVVPAAIAGNGFQVEYTPNKN